jgi:hypothetical protein
MRMGLGFLCAFMLSCVAADEANLGTSSEALWTIPIPITLPVYAEYFDPRTSNITLPTDATRLEVIIRRGYDATWVSPANFHAFIVSDGTRIRRALRISNSQYGAFLNDVNTAFITREGPGSNRSHCIAGSLWVGPHPSGPPGDPFPNSYLNSVLNAAANLHDAAQLAIESPL